MRGAAELQEKISGNTSSVGLTLTLALPDAEIVRRGVLTGTAPYVRGFVFVDANQNGERDGAEVGLAGQTVTLTPAGGAALTTTTGADGGYLFQGVAAGAYTLGAGPAAAGRLHRGLLGHAADHPDRPADLAADPQRLAAGGDFGRRRASRRWSTRPTPAERSRAAISRATMPQDRPVEPHLNFGYVPAHSCIAVDRGLQRPPREAA